MIPIFFPSTFVLQSSLDTCLEWFEKIIVYQPSHLDIPEHYQNNQRLIVKTPLESQIDINQFNQEKLYLKSLGNDFGPNLDHFKSRSEDLPFFDETSVHRIHAQIKQKAPQADDKPLLIALYCQLFQEYDKQQADLNYILTDIEQTHTQLFQQLNCELSNPLSQAVNHDTKVVTHIQDRLKIFFHLYQYDEENSGILVTDHKDFILEIQEWNEDLEMVLQIDASLMTNAKQLLKDHLGMSLYQMSLIPKRTKKILLYHLKTPIRGPFIPSNLNTYGNTRMIVFESC